jgi:transporter family protein
MSSWVVFALSGIASWGLWSFLLKIVLRRGMDFYLVTVLSSAGTLIVACIAMAVFAGPIRDSVHASAAWFALAGGVLGGVSVLAYIASLERGPASVIVPLYALSPSVTVGLSLVLLREHLKPVQYAGVLVAFAAAIIMSRKEGSE